MTMRVFRKAVSLPLSASRSLSSSSTAFSGVSSISSFRPFSSQSKTAAFYGVNPSSPSPSTPGLSSIPASVRGEVVDVGVNLQNARPGDVIEVPYELTVTEGLKEFWAAAFYCHDRISTSTPFARKLG